MISELGNIFSGYSDAINFGVGDFNLNLLNFSIVIFIFFDDNVLYLDRHDRSLLLFHGNRHFIRQYCLLSLHSSIPFDSIFFLIPSHINLLQLLRIFLHLLSAIILHLFFSFDSLSLKILELSPHKYEIKDFFFY